MIALSAGHRKGPFAVEVDPPDQAGGATECHAESHGNVSRIILLPHFRPSPAALLCDKRILRWPGPFGSGFLSPQPPGVVGIGPVRRGVNPNTLGQRKLVLFVFGRHATAQSRRPRAAREPASFQWMSGCKSNAVARRAAMRLTE